GGSFEKRFTRIGSECGQRLQPFVRRAVFVKLPLLRFGRDSNLPLKRRIVDHDEVPRLQVSPVRRRARALQTELNYLPRDGASGKIADGGASCDLLVKCSSAGEQLIVAQIWRRVRQGNELRFVHGRNRKARGERLRFPRETRN